MSKQPKKIIGYTLVDKTHGFDFMYNSNCFSIYDTKMRASWFKNKYNKLQKVEIKIIN